MNNIRRLGKTLKDTKDNAGYNVRRAAENFPKIDHPTNKLDKLHPYTASFRTTSNTAYLDLSILDDPTPCTINPPVSNVGCKVELMDGNPGIFTRFIYNEGGFTIQNNATIVPGPAGAEVGAAPVDGVVVPKSGCYSVYWLSNAAAYTQMRGNGTVGMAILHNGSVVRTLTYPAQGVWGFGGGVWTYAPPSPVYIVVEALEGDVIGAGLYETIRGVLIDWFIPRDFNLFMNGDNTTSVEIKLIASYEG